MLLANNEKLAKTIYILYVKLVIELQSTSVKTEHKVDSEINPSDLLLFQDASTQANT